MTCGILCNYIWVKEWFYQPMFQTYVSTLIVTYNEFERSIFMKNHRCQLAILAASNCTSLLGTWHGTACMDSYTLNKLYGICTTTHRRNLSYWRWFSFWGSEAVIGKLNTDVVIFNNISWVTNFSKLYSNERKMYVRLHVNRHFPLFHAEVRYIRYN